MLRQLSRSISRGRERERSVSPEFVSKDARVAEARAASAEGNRVSHARDQDAMTFEKAGNVSPDETAAPFYLDSTLEALSLEPIVSRTLRRMRPSIAHKDALLPPPPRRGSAPEINFPQPPPRAAQPMRGHLDRDAVILRAPIPGITVTPAATQHGSETNPYEESLADAPLQITPLPSRPLLRRNALSYRTQRELPLRVQAVRRAHQEEFARSLALRSPILPGARRASESHANPGPPPTGPLPRPPMPPRSQSVGRERGCSPGPAAFNPPQARGRSHSSHSSQSRPPLNRLPSVLEDAPYVPDEPIVPDWYLQAALSDWTFDP